MQDKVLQMAYSPLVQDQFKKVYISTKKKSKKKNHTQMIFTPLLEKVCLLHDYVINYNENENYNKK